MSDRENYSIGQLTLGGVLVTSTAAELNAAPFGLTATASEINDALDGCTAGFAELNILDGATLTTAEINFLAGVTLGTRTVSKALTVDASGTIDALDIDALSLNGTLVTASAAEVNILTGATVTVAQLNAVTQLWRMGVPGIWAVAGDGYVGSIAGAPNTLDLTLTEAVAAFAVVSDASDTEYTLAGSASGAGYALAYQPFPGTEAENDAVYFGAVIPFCELQFDIDTTATHNAADGTIWEYWNGAWTTLPIIWDETDANNGSGARAFSQDGALSFIPPANWAVTTINSQEAFWVRSRLIATVDITQTPTMNSVEHKVVTPTDGFLCPIGGTVTSIRLINANTTVHSGNDIKFFLMNFTTGLHSGELTFPQSKNADYFGSLTLVVSADDELGVVITQEDTTNEVTNATLELTVTPTA